MTVSCQPISAADEARKFLSSVTPVPAFAISSGAPNRAGTGKSLVIGQRYNRHQTQ
jgi:hypothetical protein